MSDVVFPEGYVYTDRPLARRLYEAYNAGGPPERANPSWDGKPCPSWEQLDAWAAEGKAGPAGVIEKWIAVANVLEQAVTSVLEFASGPAQLAMTAKVRAISNQLVEPRNVGDLAAEGVRSTWPMLADLVSTEPGDTITRCGVYRTRVRLNGHTFTCRLYVVEG